MRGGRKAINTVPPEEYPRREIDIGLLASAGVPPGFYEYRGAGDGAGGLILRPIGGVG